MSQRIAVITGANRGLGFATTRVLAQKGIHVILTARSREKADAAVASLAEEGLTVEGAVLDVASAESVAAFFAWLQESHGRLDILINNAGVIFESGEAADFAASSILNIEPELVLTSFQNNTLSAYRMVQKAVPMMREGGYGRIVNVSSGLGGLTEMGRGFAAYRTSKTAMNALTRFVSQELSGDLKINSVCPGWVKTDMGGPNATRNIDEGIAGIVWAATLDSDGPNGGFFRDGEAIDW